MTDGLLVHSDGRNTMSVKEAVQIARNNNLMGLICCQRLLVSQSQPPNAFQVLIRLTQSLAPGLITTIKEAGLVLVTDVSEIEDQAHQPLANTASSNFFNVPEGVDGTLKGNGVLRFNDSIDM